MKNSFKFPGFEQGLEQARATPPKSSKKRAVKPSLNGGGGDNAGYIPGLDGTSQPAAAIPWSEDEAVRWWVRRGATGRRRTHSLMFGAKKFKSGKGVVTFHQFVCEAEYLNERSHAPHGNDTLHTEPNRPFETWIGGDVVESTKIDFYEAQDRGMLIEFWPHWSRVQWRDADSIG